MRPLKYAISDWAAFLLYSWLQLCLTWHLWGQVSWGAVVALTVIAYVLMDLVSGIVHWGADTWGRQDFPVLGPMFLAPFRIHHLYPRAMVRHGLVESSGNTCWLAVPVLVAAIFLPPLWATFLVSLTSFGVLVNNAHRWAHGRLPWALSWWGPRLVLVSARHHDIHHETPGHTRNYCVLAGWWDPVLNRVLPWAERTITYITGAVPRGDA